MVANASPTSENFVKKRPRIIDSPAEEWGVGRGRADPLMGTQSFYASLECPCQNTAEYDVREGVSKSARLFEKSTRQSPHQERWPVLGLKVARAQYFHSHHGSAGCRTVHHLGELPCIDSDSLGRREPGLELWPPLFAWSAGEWGRCAPATRDHMRAAVNSLRRIVFP